MLPLDFEPGRQPASEEVLCARKAAGLTQTRAAESVYLGSYVRWMEYERGTTRMDPARYELFLVKHGLHPGYTARK